jgi:Flp pilus assembly protein TadG
MRRPFPSELSRTLRDRRGTSAVEFALVAPVLLLMMAGLIDGSRLIVRTMQVRAAAQAGADYALGHGWDFGQIQAAVRSATPLAAEPLPAPAETQGCVSEGVVAPTAAATCPNGGAAGRFVTVWAKAPFSPLMAWPGVPLPKQVTAQAQVRIP